MCCRLELTPPDVEAVEALIKLFQFKESGKDTFSLLLPTDQTIQLNVSPGSVVLKLYPSIVAFNDHIGKRLQASLYYMFAGRYVEMTGGTAVQKALIAGCNGDIEMKPYPGSRDLLIAAGDYHIRHTSICNGFQHEMKGTELDSTIF